MAEKYTRRITLWINDKEVKNNIRSITKEFHKSRNELSHMTRGSKEYDAQLKKVARLKGMMDDHNSKIRESSKQWNKSTTAAKKHEGIISKIKGAAGQLLPAFSFALIVAGAIKGAKALRS